MAKRAERKAETREKILAAAAACFAEKGYAGCGVADIAARAECSQGNLYVHFKNKEELFRTMIEDEHRQGVAKIARFLDSPPYLRGILDILKDCIRDVGFPVDHRLWTEILAVVARDASLRTAFLESDRAMRAAFVDLLTKAAQAGEIDATLDFDSVSIWLYALVDGLIARAADEEAFDFTKHLAVFETLVRRALRPQG